MKLGISTLFKRFFSLFSLSRDPDTVTIQNVHGNLEDVKVMVLFRPLRQLIEDGTPERVELLHVLAAVFSNNPNMVVGEVIQATPFDLENQGVTSAQIKALEEILSKEGLALCTEIYRPTWQELVDEAMEDLEERSDRSPMGRSGPT